jgi:hypothetical protein
LRWNSRIFILLYRVFLFLRMTSKYYILLKSKWTNKTQVALEFLNFYIIERSFFFEWHQNIIYYWKANGQIKLRLRWNSWIFILLNGVFLFLRMTSKYYILLKSKWTNKTQVALEFLNFHIVEQNFTFLTDWHRNTLTYRNASGQIKLRLR